MRHVSQSYHPHQCEFLSLATFLGYYSTVVDPVTAPKFRV